MVVVTDTKGFFQSVFESLLWCLSVMMFRGKLAKQYDPG